MPHVDFAELKARLPIADAIPLLGLEMKERGEQRRGPCPAWGKGHAASNTAGEPHTKHGREGREAVLRGERVG